MYSRNRQLFLIVLMYLLTAKTDSSLVTKHKPKKQSPRKGEGSRENGPVREKYTTGVCQEGNDDVTLYKQTHEQCFTECRSRSLCTAINFYTKVGVCRLNFQKNLTKKVCQKYIFSEKKNWKQKSIPGCENQQCLKTHKCVVSKGKPACFATGCENIKSIEHGVMYGNLVEVGKSRGFRCNKGYNLIGSKKITCQPNGQWSDKVPVCSADKEHNDPETPETNTTSKFKTTRTTPPPSSTTPTTIISQKPSSKTVPVEHKLTTNPNKTVPTTTLQSHSTKQASSQALITELSTTYGNSSISYSLSAERESSTYSDYWKQTTTETISKDKFRSGYDTYCDTWTILCEGPYLECRQQKCQCKFSLVFDPESYSCVEGCTTLGKTYQTYDEIFVTSFLDTQGHITPASTLRRCLNLCTRNHLCTFVTVKDDDVEMRCVIYESPLNTISKEQKVGYTTFLRNCGYEESGSVIVGSVRVNGEESSSILPPDKNNESDRSSTDTTVTKTEEITTRRSTVMEDLPTDASDGALTENSTTKLPVTTSDQSATSTPSTGWTKEPEDIEDYISPRHCAPGSVNCYTRRSCTHECDTMSTTFQKYSHYNVQSYEDYVLEESHSLSECLYKCTQTINCNLVISDERDINLPACYLVNQPGIPSQWVYLSLEIGMTVWVRDCEDCFVGLFEDKG